MSNWDRESLLQESPGEEEKEKKNDLMLCMYARGGGAEVGWGG